MAATPSSSSVRPVTTLPSGPPAVGHAAVSSLIAWAGQDSALERWSVGGEREDAQIGDPAAREDRLLGLPRAAGWNRGGPPAADAALSGLGW
eukprot:4054972-Lingulodinium_polyedra.AAC.1